jgi:hypothetical protein
VTSGETERIEGCDPEDWDEVLLKLEDRSRVADTLSSFLVRVGMPLPGLVLTFPW